MIDFFRVDQRRLNNKTFFQKLLSIIHENIKYLVTITQVGPNRRAWMIKAAQAKGNAHLSNSRGAKRNNRETSVVINIA